MRRIGDLLEELGFRLDAPESSQRAFIKHLARTAEVAQTQRQIKNLPHHTEQMSFSDEILNPPQTQVSSQPETPSAPTDQDKKVG